MPAAQIQDIIQWLVLLTQEKYAAFVPDLSLQILSKAARILRVRLLVNAGAYYHNKNPLSPDSVFEVDSL
jgi:hypothetical protein